MKFDIQFLNCLWLLLPLLVWNIALAPRITDPRITSNNLSPKWLIISENILRIIVFTLPLLLPLQIRDITSKTGLWIYISGTLIYFATWLPFLFVPQSVWCKSVTGLLAPRLTPFLVFLGIALIGHSWPYAAIAAIFILFHTWHGINNLH